MDDRARRDTPPYETFEEASAEARALGTRNRLEYDYFVELRLDPRLPEHPAAQYLDFHEKGGWDAFLGKTPIVRPKPQPPRPASQTPEPEPPAPTPAPAPPMARPEPEAVVMPSGAKASVRTGRPKRLKPPPAVEAHEEPLPVAKKPPPEPKKPSVPRMRRNDLKSEEAKRVFDMFSCITGDWDD